MERAVISLKSKLFNSNPWSNRMLLMQTWWGGSAGVRMLLIVFNVIAVCNRGFPKYIGNRTGFCSSAVRNIGLLI